MTFKTVGCYRDGFQVAITRNDYSWLEMTGQDSVGAAIGIANRIKAKKGCWITLAEWKNINNKWIPKCVSSAEVDGKKIKASVWYELKNGKFKEVKE